MELIAELQMFIFKLIESEGFWATAFLFFLFYQSKQNERRERYFNELVMNHLRELEKLIQQERGHK